MKKNNYNGKYASFYYASNYQKEKNYLIFYENSIVICYLDKEYVKDETKKYIFSLEGQKLNRPQKLDRAMKYWTSYGKKFADMHDTEALAQNERNILIPIDDVKEVEYKRTTDTSAFIKNIFIRKSREHLYRGHIKIKTNTNEYIVYHSYYYVKNIENGLKNQLGSLLTILEG